MVKLTQLERIPIFMKIFRFIAIMLTFGTFTCHGGGLIHWVSHLLHFHNREDHSFEHKLHKKRERYEAVKRNEEARNQGKEPSQSDIKKEAKAIYKDAV